MSARTRRYQTALIVFFSNRGSRVGGDEGFGGYGALGGHDNSPQGDMRGHRNDESGSEDFSSQNVNNGSCISGHEGLTTWAVMVRGP